MSHQNLLLDRLIDQAMGELEERKAIPMYERVQGLIEREANWVPLYNITDAIGYRSDLKGLVQWPGGGLYWFDRVYF